MAKRPILRTDSTSARNPTGDNQNSITAAPPGLAVLARPSRERISERPVHANG